MSDNPNAKVKVISGNSKTAFERWETPNVKTLEQEHREKQGLLTASQLEALQKEAYEEGLKLGKDEGYQVGFKEGQEAGQIQGLQDGQELISQIVKRFEQVIQFLAEPLAQVNQEVENELLDLSMATAKQIIRREIHADPGQIMAVIKEAISALPSNAKKISIYLHPADAEIVRENLRISTDENTNHSEESPWNIVDEPGLTRGGCRVETDASLIDATIEKRIAEIAAQILGDERTRDTDKNETGLSAKEQPLVSNNDS